MTIDSPHLAETSAPSKFPSASASGTPVPPGSVGYVAPELVRFDEPLQLTSGQVLPQYELAVETYGDLHGERNDAGLIRHPWSASHHVAGMAADPPRDVGWWDNVVGPGKAAGTARFFVIGINNVGSCFGSTGPASINPATGKPW